MRGEPVVTVRVNWLMGQEHLDPAVDASAASERFEVEVAGEPPVQVDFHGLHPARLRDEAALARNPGIAATAMHCVNAVPYVCARRARASAPISTCPSSAGAPTRRSPRRRAARDPRPLQAHRPRRARDRRAAAGSARASRSPSPRRAPTSCAPRAPQARSRRPRRACARSGAARSPSLRRHATGGPRAARRRPRSPSSAGSTCS